MLNLVLMSDLAAVQVKVSWHAFISIKHSDGCYIYMLSKFIVYLNLGTWSFFLKKNVLYPAPPAAGIFFKKYI
eukprot:SAG31_NODE_505_length_14757_cov_20.172943_1_plen_73_part_00